MKPTSNNGKPGRRKLPSVPVEPKALRAYRDIVPKSILERLSETARRLRGARILHINATPHGGGVAELLRGTVPLMRDLGIIADWRIIAGDHEFFRITKTIHNALQGNPVGLSRHDEEIYERTVESNAALLDGAYDFIVVHDPQPAALPTFRSPRSGRWIWRCHIDTSKPNPEVWRFLCRFLSVYDAAVFTLDDFVPTDLPIERVRTIPVAIDPLSPKNLDVGERLARSVIEWLGLSTEHPMLAQVARFDPWKDPLGVVRAYREVRRNVPRLQLALVGAMVADDPEGQKIRDEVVREAADDPLIHIISSGVGNLEVNAIQRTADVCVQKSLREGFGLVVSEALWKETPVVAGRVGGIPLQIEDGVSGFLVSSVEECADRILRLLEDRALARRLAKRGRETVRERFLLPRLLLDELALLADLAGTDQFVRAPEWLDDHDPVCGMALAKSPVRVSASHEGRSYGFCSETCAGRFHFDARRYIVHAPGAVSAAASRRVRARAPLVGTGPGDVESC